MSGPTLPQLLNALSVTALRAVAEGRDIKGTGTRKSELVTGLVAQAGDPATLRRMLDQLSPPQRTLLERLLPYPGLLPGALVQALAQDAGLIDPPAQGSYPYFGYYQPLPGNRAAASSRNLADLVAGLAWRLLALPANEGYGQLDLGMGQYVVVPAPVRAGLVAVLAPTVPPSSSPPPETVRPADTRTLQRALFQVWLTARARPLGLTQAGLLRKADTRRLAAALGVAPSDFTDETDLPYVYLARLVAQGIGLLLVAENRLEVAPRARAARFLDLPPGAAATALLDAWLTSGLGPLIGLLVPVFNQTLREPPPPDTFQRGLHRLAGVLAGLSDGWIAVEAFIAWLRLHHFGLFALDTPDPLQEQALGSRMFHSSYSLRDPWDGLEGTLVRAALRGPLHWLGVVDLGGGPDPDRFRVSATGRAMIAALGDVGAAHALTLPTEPGRVVVQPNFEIVVVGDVPLPLLFQLGEVAVLAQADRAIAFQITRESVFAALAAGWTGDQIQHLLSKASATPLPQNVVRSLRDWAAAQEQIVITPGAALLSVTDPALLDALLADPAVGPLLGERLGPTHILAPADGPGQAALDAALLARGELPATSDLDREGPAPAFRFDNAGRVTWTTPVPDLRLLGLLAPLAASEADGTLRLLDAAPGPSGPRTAEEALALLGRLAAWHRGPLPPAVVARIQGWGGLAGHARVEPARLLVLDRPEILAALLADPALAAFLTALPASAAVLTLAPDAPPANQARFRAALLRHGLILTGDDGPGDATST